MGGYCYYQGIREPRVNQLTLHPLTKYGLIVKTPETKESRLGKKGGETALCASLLWPSER